MEEPKLSSETLVISGILIIVAFGKSFIAGLAIAIVSGLHALYPYYIYHRYLAHQALLDNNKTTRQLVGETDKELKK